MQISLTDQQKQIIESQGDLKVNAVAGSGKTRTLIEFVKNKKKKENTLYIAFNKSVKHEAQEKFKSLGLNKVRVETAHSLAYKFVVKQNNYTVKKGSYKSYEVAQQLYPHDKNLHLQHFIACAHVIHYAAYFCNSDKARIDDLNYLDVIPTGPTYDYVNKYYPQIKSLTKLWLQLMNDGQIDISHDFYLKKFALMNQTFKYKLILFDEAQDASPAMVNLFLNQKATKIFVGDSFQQLYSWRYAINALDALPFKSLSLDTSFRFTNEIAEVANAILQIRCSIDDKTPPKIIGAGEACEIKSKAIIGRTNAGILKMAIDKLKITPDIPCFHFEGHFRNYTYVESGSSIKDLLHLLNGKNDLIKDFLVKRMENIQQLEDYISNTGDIQLKLMLDLVLEYRNDLPALISKVQGLQVLNKEEAQLVFSTTHKAKGLEYDEVTLADDFIKFEDLQTFKTIKKSPIEKIQLCEEMNLLYVAVTRAKTRLNLPKSLSQYGIRESTNVKFY